MAELPHCASCRVSIHAGQNVVFRADGRVQHVACPEVRCTICSRPVTPNDPIRRDGEELVHGNCRVTGQRDSMKPPVKMMPEPDGITSIVRAKLMAGTLPRVQVDKVWTGLGKGLPCGGCGRTIMPTEVEHAFDDGSSRLRFHRNCMSVWQREVATPRSQIAGGSAASPWTTFFDLHIAHRAAHDRAAYEEFRAATRESWLMAADTRLRSRAVRSASQAIRRQARL